MKYGCRKRPHCIATWLDPREHAVFVERCDGAEESRAGVMRALAIEYGAGRSVAPDIYRQLGAIREELRRLGVNLNQLLHLAHANMLQGADPELRRFVPIMVALLGVVQSVERRLAPYLEAL